MDAMRATAELPILASSTSLIDNAKIRHFFCPLRLNDSIGYLWGNKVEKNVVWLRDRPCFRARLGNR